jgi:hypothetical protein
MGKPKPGILAAGIVGVIVVVGGTGYLATKKDDPKTNQNTNTSQTSTDEDTALVDPNGDYDLFSDASITKNPDNDVLFGNGQTLTWEYDGSKSENDPYATLSYQLYYIQDNGAVIPMTGGNVEGKGSGTFTLSDKVFQSNAKDRKGFLELIVTYDTSAAESGQISGKNVTLGMYSVKFDVE